ncbi:MAG: hypothetical protein J6B09_01810 [Clostridia bacterium]|nr:hypothetical protein [Clostridia bacterium]
MKTKKILRFCAMLLALVMAVSLCGCSSSGAMRPTAIANKVVARADDIDITYDSLYYVTMTRIKELKIVYGEDALADPQRCAELETFVKANLLTRAEALISIGHEYGLDIEKGDIAANVQAEIDAMLQGSFEGDEDAYAEGLNAMFMTDRYLRAYLATENYLSKAIISEMLMRDEIDDSDETARNLINSDSFLHTVHVFIDRGNGKTDEENRANAAALQARVAAKTTSEERYEQMRKELGGVYNNDYFDLLGNGYYFTRGETERVYEDAAFALNDYEVSPVIESVEGYYIVMRLPKDENYIADHFQELKEKTYYVKLNEMVDQRLSTMTLEMTNYGERLDLLELPPIDADGGEGAFVAAVVISCVICCSALFAVVYMISKKKGKLKKKAKK